jgi:hypothetical protein
MWLLLSWDIGFLAKFIAYTLSIFNVTVSELLHVISSMRFFNQIACVAHIDAAMYSTSHDDKATTYSFSEHQEINALPIKNMYLTAGFLSSTSPHQLASVNPVYLQFLPTS